MLIFVFFSEVTATEDRYKRISIISPADKINGTKSFNCFDTTIKGYGTREQVKRYGKNLNGNYIGLVDNSKCKKFEKKYEIGVYKHSSGTDIVCYEYDKRKKDHKKVVRFINSSNRDITPCREQLKYIPRRISKKCANHINCKLSICHFDVFSEDKFLLTRQKYSKDVITKDCAPISIGYLLTKSGTCFEYDQKTFGDNTFFENYSGGCSNSESIVITEYHFLRPSNNILDYLGSYISGKDCYEVDGNGGDIFKKKVNNILCSKEQISGISRNNLKKTDNSIPPQQNIQPRVRAIAK